MQAPQGVASTGKARLGNAGKEGISVARNCGAGQCRQGVARYGSAKQGVAWQARQGKAR